jgi:hypothetical protein
MMLGAFVLRNVLFNGWFGSLSFLSLDPEDDSSITDISA